MRCPVHLVIYLMMPMRIFQHHVQPVQHNTQPYMMTNLMAKSCVSRLMIHIVKMNMALTIIGTVIPVRQKIPHIVKIIQVQIITGMAVIVRQRMIIIVNKKMVHGIGSGMVTIAKETMIYIVKI